MHADSEEGDEVRVRRKGARKGEPDQAPPEGVGANAIGAKLRTQAVGVAQRRNKGRDTDARHASAKRYTHTYTAQHCRKLRARKAGGGT